MGLANMMTAQSRWYVTNTVYKTAAFTRFARYLAFCRIFYDYLEEDDGKPRPLDYSEFHIPLGKGAVRPIVLHLNSCSVQLCKLATSAAQEIVSVLPPGN